MKELCCGKGRCLYPAKWDLPAWLTSSRTQIASSPPERFGARRFPNWEIPGNAVRLRCPSSGASGHGVLTRWGWEHILYTTALYAQKKSDSTRNPTAGTAHRCFSIWEDKFRLVDARRESEPFSGNPPLLLHNYLRLKQICWAEGFADPLFYDILQNTFLSV